MADDLKLNLTVNDELTPSMEAASEAMDTAKASAEKLAEQLDELEENVQDVSDASSGMDRVHQMLNTSLDSARGAVLDWSDVMKGAVTVLNTYIDAADNAAREDLKNALEAVAQQAEATAMRISHLTDMLERFTSARDAMLRENGRHSDAVDTMENRVRQLQLKEQLANAKTPEERAEIQRRFDETQYEIDKEKTSEKYGRQRTDAQNRLADNAEKRDILDQQEAARKSRMKRLQGVLDDLNANDPADAGFLKKAMMSVQAVLGKDAMAGITNHQQMVESVMKEIQKEGAEKLDIAGKRRELDDDDKLQRMRLRHADLEEKAALRLLKEQHEHDRAEKDRAEQRRAEQELAKAKEAEAKAAEKSARDAEKAQRDRERAEDQLLKARQKQAREAQRDASARVRAAGAALGGANDALAAFNESWRKRGTREWRDAKKEEREAEKEARKQERRDAADRKRYDENIERISRKAYFGGKYNPFALSSGERELLANDTAMRKEKKRLEGEAAQAAADLEKAKQDAQKADEATIKIAELLASVKTGDNGAAIRTTTDAVAQP